jgi:hypothetical protein
MNKQPLSALSLEILNIMLDPKTDDGRMTNAAIYARSEHAESLHKVSQTLNNCTAKNPPLVERHKTDSGAHWSITEAGIARANQEAPDHDGEDSEEPPVLDCAVWMSGDVSIIHGETNITLKADEAGKIAGYLAQNLDADSFAQRVAQTVMNRITAKLFAHPDDKAPASDPGVGFTESPFFVVDPGNHDQAVVLQPNKFDAFLRDSRADTAATQVETKRVPIGAEWLATLPARPTTEPTEATGLPGVEFDGPGGIKIPVFGQPPEAMSRADQFQQAAARG